MSPEGLVNPSPMPANHASSVEALIGRATPNSQLKLRRPPSWLRKKRPAVTLSLLLHLLAMGICGLFVLKNPQLVEEIFTTVIDREEIGEPIVERSMIVSEEVKDIPQEINFSGELTSKFQFETIGPIDLNIDDSIPQIAKVSGDLPGPVKIRIGDVTSGRMSAETRSAMVRRFGGNSESEAAVALGLKWLIRHQMSNGSWNFEHSKHPGCKGQCSQNGSLKSCPNGATGLALLALLGAGHTHHGGDYQKEVKRGLDFLLKTSKTSADDGRDFRGYVVGNEGMYVQGLCTIAFCECAAMTNDSRMRKAAEGAIEFIVKAQNPVDGGWRYVPRARGDTSVVGWQVMALRSAHNSRISVSPKTFKGVETFLDLAQQNRGSEYVYYPGDTRQQSSSTPSMTAVGLLCRMYLGWDRTNPSLINGIEYLDRIKPLPDDMYFNYYGTQVMHHWGGEEWTRWNEVMRNQLVRSQHLAKDGHLAGSWDVADPHGGAGGRLYMTCLSLMTLEVYYRHLPLYNLDLIKGEL